MRIGLVLSGGGARSFAHLGVIKALTELQLPIHKISGVSSGALAGAFYGAGYSPEEIFRRVTETNFLRLMRPAFSRVGLIKLNQLEAALAPYFKDLTFADLNPRLIVSATDFNSAITIYYSEGSIVRPLMASIALPILFQPVTYQDRLLVDGGLLNNLPVECLLGHCDFIIGVHINPLDYQSDITTFRGMFERTLRMAIYNNVEPRLKLCHFFIEPPQLKNYSLLDIKHAREMFDCGYEHTMLLGDNLLAAIEQFQNGE